MSILTKEEKRELQEELDYRGALTLKREDGRKKIIKTYKRKKRAVYSSKLFRIITLVICGFIVFSGVKRGEEYMFIIGRWALIAAFIFYCNLLTLIVKPGRVMWFFGFIPLMVSIVLGAPIRLSEEALKLLSTKGKPKIAKILMGLTLVLLILTPLFNFAAWFLSLIRRFIGKFPKQAFPDIYKHHRIRWCWVTKKEEKNQTEKWKT